MTVPSTNGAKPGKNLGVSSCTDNKLDKGFVRKHGAKSSSNRSPWQPTIKTETVNLMIIFFFRLA